MFSGGEVNLKKSVHFLLLTFILALAGCNFTDTTSKSTKDSEKAKVVEEEKIEEEVIVEEKKEEKPVEDESTQQEDLSKDKEKVQVYVDEVRRAYMEIAELGGRWDELRSASASQTISDPEFGDYIAMEILPWNMMLIEHLEAIVPPNEEIVTIHEMLIEAMNKQHLAFSEILDAITTGDYTKITKANEILSEVRKMDRDFSRNMEALIQKYGVL